MPTCTYTCEKDKKYDCSYCGIPTTNKNKYAFPECKECERMFLDYGKSPVTKFVDNVMNFLNSKNIIPSLKYLKTTTIHKYYVFKAGLITKTPIWQLIIHDLSKYSPAELPHYGRQFYGDKSQPEKFAEAWLHHQNHNPHHWEYWISRQTHDRQTGSTAKLLPMPEKYVREMIADWMGASKTYSGHFPTNLKDWEWFNKNIRKIHVNLHPETQLCLRKILDETFDLGYNTCTEYDSIWTEMYDKHLIDRQRETVAQRAHELTNG